MTIIARSCLAILLLAVASALHAASELQQLNRDYDFEASIDAYARIVAPTPADDAFYAFALASIGRTDEASAVAARLTRRAPGTPVAVYAAVAVARAVWNLRPVERLSGQLTATPDVPEEFVRLHGQILGDFNRFDDAISLTGTRPATPYMRATRALLLVQRVERSSSRDLRDAATREMESLVINAPDVLESHYLLGGYLLDERRPAEAYAIAKAAAARWTSLGMHEVYWRAIAEVPDVPAADRRAELQRDLESLMAGRGSDPGFELAVARAYVALDAHDEAERWRARILRDAPESFAAGEAIFNRYEAYRALAAATNVPEETRTLESIRLLRDVLAYPHLRSESTRKRARAALLTLLMLRPNASNEELIALIEPSLADITRNAPRAIQVALLLADRATRLDIAEDLARAAIDSAARNARESRDSGAIAQFTILAARSRAALGTVLLAKGDVAAARTQLLASIEIAPTATGFHRLGRLYELQKEDARAERAYARGVELDDAAANPNRTALAAMTQRRFGDSRAHLQTVEDRIAAHRRRKVLAVRIAAPRPAPPFRLRRLDGEEVTLAELRGKVAVVNFWGMWCGACVHEMPDLQKLAHKYARDPGVAVLTINNDVDRTKLRGWLARHNYDLPVLLGSGYVSAQKLAGFPTTWVLDRDGRIAFDVLGGSESLVDEFTWRIEALRGAAK